MLGSWKFTVTQDAFKVDPYKVNTVCTHRVPNLTQLVRKGEDFQFGQENEVLTRILKVEVKEPNLAYVYENQKEPI